MKRTNYGKAVGAMLFALLWLLPLGAAAQVEKAQVRIDGMV